jgi:hypothetical protein
MHNLSDALCKNPCYDSVMQVLTYLLQIYFMFLVTDDLTCMETFD